MFDTLIIGAGQAGLAASFYLQKARHSFLLLEAGATPTGSWSQYYESLQLFSPARYSSLPGMPFPGNVDRYPHRDEVCSYLQSYAAHYQFPITFHQKVVRVERKSDHFNVVTVDGTFYQARTLIVASGAFSQPHLPQFPGQDTFTGTILHAMTYQNATPFQRQRVLVVGAGNSAIQIAVELAQVAQVTLTSRRPVQFLTQRPFGRDIHFWMWLLGVDRYPLGSFWYRLKQNPVLDQGQYQAALATQKPDWRPLFQQLTTEGVMWSNNQTESIDSLIFATGYQFNPTYLASLPILNAHGLLHHRRGQSLTVPGLFFVGLTYQQSYASATLRGVGPDAAWVVHQITQHLQHRPHSRSRPERLPAS